LKKASDMKIFVSSVRRGLEDERDALPGLILALGHQPIRFEDFTAQPVASREACLRGVEEADAYLLILGSSYGEPVFDTGLSPTEEEWNAARRRGIPILVFRKDGIEMDEGQQEFARKVEEFTGGRFRVTFARPVDLQTEVVRAISELASGPEKLVWRPMVERVQVPWVQGANGFQRSISQGAIVECHLVTVSPEQIIQATALESLPTALARIGRDHGLFSAADGLDVDSDTDRAWAIAGQAVRDLSRGIQVRRDGTSSVWIELPGDGLGQIFDRQDIEERVSKALSIAADASPRTPKQVAPAIGVAPINMLVEGRIEDLGRRTSATFGSPRYDVVRTEPVDSIPQAALPMAAKEVASELVARLTQVFRASRNA
jgi:hypothetical protein